jgi:hypothetical protein
VARELKRLDSLGHSGYTGPGFVGPTGNAGATGATGPSMGGTAVIVMVARRHGPSDGYHPHETVSFQSPPWVPAAFDVQQPALHTSLDFVIAGCAVSLAAGNIASRFQSPSGPPADTGGTDVPLALRRRQ